jgi:hypothetical protein
VLSYYRII